MNDYKKLAIRYLELNKRRSIITILGVVVAVTVLYTILNLGWSALLNQRKILREKQDYEIVFMTENQSQIDAIMSDSKVKSASIAAYYAYDYYNPVMYDNALYINTTNPYRMNKIQDELEATYGVKSELNDEIAWTYMQGDNANTTLIMILSVLLISFIFAIFGVGVVRNSIQLSTLEQIKDYGNMRCIGATKGQLKAIIYLEGAILEITGNIIGIFVGFVVSCIIGYFLKWEVGFNIVPMIPILIAFLGDLYFAMDENCKVVSDMSPISAIRGEFRIRKEKIKARKKNIYGKLFGVEGDYAYKSIMRNPGRFYKTVWSLGFAIAGFIVLAGIVNSIAQIAKAGEEDFGYYQIYFENINNLYQTPEEVKSNLPPAQMLSNISNLKEVTEAKRVYASRIGLVDYKAFCEKYTEDYVNSCSYGGYVVEHALSDSDRDFDLVYSGVDCQGYDETDYNRLEDLLIEGTLDVSKHGIVLMNCGTMTIETDGDSLYNYKNIDGDYTTYTVGDTIDIIDMKEYYARMEVELEKLEASYQKELLELPETTETAEDTQEDMSNIEMSPEEELDYKYYRLKMETYEKCGQQLIDEGLYKTYTVEGILKDDMNSNNNDTPKIILPLERYYELTGTDESMLSGMKYHFERFSCNNYNNAVEEAVGGLSVDIKSILLCDSSEYPYFRSIIESMRNVIIGVAVVILFVVSMSVFNIINTTASNLHLRKKELAQLRVIGVSKKRLMKMVMLEGVISSIVANIIGVLLGTALSVLTFYLVIGIAFELEYVFPIGGTIAAMLFFTLILCGAVYMPLRELKQDIAGDLAMGSE